MGFQKSIHKSIETVEIQKPNSPQITVSNPLDKETFVNGIELILEPEFSQKGTVIILINNIPVFDETSSQGFFGYSKYPIPLNKALDRDGTIEVYAWNRIDSNEIKMSMNLSISENPEPFQSQAVPLDRNVFNAVVSESDVAFPAQIYSNETVTKLISLTGFKKVLLMIAPSLEMAPTIHDTSMPFPNIENCIDLDLATETGLHQPAPIPQYVVIDYGSIITKEPFTYLTTVSGTLFLTMDVSEDGINWTNIIPNTAQGVGSGGYGAGLGAVDFRYQRLGLRCNISGTANVQRLDATDVAGTVILDEIGFSSISNILDFDFGTSSSTETITFTSPYIDIDFGEDKNRIGKVQWKSEQAYAMLYSIYTSSDGINWNFQTSLADSTTNIKTLETTFHSFRYLRWTPRQTSTNLPQIKLFEIYDANTTGGTASISFEILETASNTWIELVSADSIGAISKGGGSARQLGDVVESESSNRFNVSFPSSQTALRIKLLVVDNLNIGVSIIKVS